MTAVHAALTALIAGILIIAGVAVLASLGWALIVAGALLAAVTVLLYEPAKKL